MLSSQGCFMGVGFSGCYSCLLNEDITTGVGINPKEVKFTFHRYYNIFCGLTRMGSIG